MILDVLRVIEVGARVVAAGGVLYVLVRLVAAEVGSWSR